MCEGSSHPAHQNMGVIIMEQLTRQLEGTTITIKDIDPSLLASVTKMLDGKINRGVSLSKIHEEMKTLFPVVIGEEGAEALPEKRTYGAMPPPFDKKAKPEEPAGKRGRGRPVSDKQAKIIEFIRNAKDDGKDDKEVLDALQKDMHMEYPNAYYYLKKVYPKKHN
jgi:hypothetical protein